MDNDSRQSTADAPAPAETNPKKSWDKPALETFDIAQTTQNFGGPNTDADDATSS